jgi:MFS family permease
VGIASVTTFLVASLSWRAASFIYGIVPLAFFCVLLLSAGALFRRDADSNLKGKSDVHGLRYSKDFIIAVATGSMDALSSSSLFIFIPFLLIHRGIPAALLGSLTGAFFIGNMLGKVLIGRIVDRAGSVKVFIASELAMAALLVIISLQTSALLIAVISVVLGAVTKGTVPVINTIVTNSVPDRALYEKAFGIVSFFGGIAGVVAPTLFGLVAERFSILSVFHLSALFALLAIIPISIRMIVKKR